MSHYSKWVVNLVLNAIWLIVTILYIYKITYLKYCLTHHKLEFPDCKGICFCGIFLFQNALMKNQSTYSKLNLYILRNKHQSSFGILEFKGL